MTKNLLLILLFPFIIATATAQDLQSPDNHFKMHFSLQDSGTPVYNLSFKGKEIIKPGKLGFYLKNDKKSILNISW